MRYKSWFWTHFESFKFATSPTLNKLKAIFHCLSESVVCLLSIFILSHLSSENSWLKSLAWRCGLGNVWQLMEAEPGYVSCHALPTGPVPWHRSVREFCLFCFEGCHTDSIYEIHSLAKLLCKGDQVNLTKWTVDKRNPYTLTERKNCFCKLKLRN